MLTKIGMGILGYILGFYFIIFITVLMLKFLCKSFVGISLSEACHRLVWGELIDKEDYEELLSSTYKEKELTKNEAINDLLEDSSHYREITYAEKDFTEIDLVIENFGEPIKHIEENAPTNKNSTKVLKQYQFTNLERAKGFAKMSTVMGYKAEIQQLTKDFYNVTLIDEEE